MKKLKSAPSVQSLPIHKKIEFIENAVDREKVNNRVIPTCLYIARRAGHLKPIELAKHYHIDAEGLNRTIKRYALYLMDKPEQKEKIEGMIREAAEYFNGHIYEQVKTRA